MTDFIVGDTGSVLKLKFVDSETNAAINLTGATVNLKWIDNTVTITKTMTITDALNGLATYQFGSTDLLSPTQVIEASITDAGGKLTTGNASITLTNRVRAA